MKSVVICGSSRFAPEMREFAKKLKDFLIKAKINTYAKGGEGGEMILDDGSKELIYAEDGWKYRDRYFGFNPFIGEEVVWKSDQAVWGMNYYGRIISNKVDAKQIYQFLKKALQLVKADRPFRGPENFSEGEWSYEDKADGLIDKFEGTEAIYFQKEKVYELKYQGGAVTKYC